MELKLGDDLNEIGLNLDNDSCFNNDFKKAFFSIHIKSLYL